MAYGTVKVDNITFDDGGSDQNVTVSGLYNSLTSGITVTGTISGAVVIGSTSVSGTTVAGVTVTGTTVQGASGTFTSLTGTTIQGTTATYTTGSFTSLTGTTIQGTTATYTTGSFTSLTGTTTTGTTANFASGVFTTSVSGTTVIASTGTFTSLTGTTTQGTTATYTTGSFTSLTGTTTTGTTSSFTSGVFTTLSGATATFTSGIIASGTAAAPSLAILADLDTGLFSPGANQLAVATNGTGRLFVDANGNIVINGSTSSGGFAFSQFVPVSGSPVNSFRVTNGSDATYDVKLQSGLATIGAGVGSLAFIANDAERMRLDTSGRLGVGTSSPSASALLDVNGNARIGSAGNFDTDTRLLVASTGGNSYIQIQGADSTGTVGLKLGRNSVANRAGIDWSASTDKLTLRTGGTSAAVTIDSSQRVGIGTSAPGQLVQIGEGDTGGGANVHTVARIEGRAVLGAQQVATLEFNQLTNAPAEFVGASIGIESSAGSRAESELVFKVSQATNTSATEAMRLSHDGRLGIGITSPVAPLDVIAARGNLVRFQESSSPYNGLVFQTASTGATIKSNASAGYLAFNTGNSEKARIDSSGRLLVGTSSARLVGQTTGSLQLSTGSSGNIDGSSVNLTAYVNNSNSGRLSFGKSRGTSDGSYTIVQSGDELGVIAFAGADGTDLASRGAEIACQVDGTPGANDMPGRLVFSTTADGAASPTERMRITSAGNVGIGTTSPGYALEVATGTLNGGLLRLRNTNASSIQTFNIVIDSSRDTNLVNGSGASGFIFTSGTAERARIDSSGRLLVGTSTSRAVAGQVQPIQNEGTTATGVSCIRNSNDAISGFLLFGKSRGATTGTSTAVIANDALGGIVFAGADGTDINTQAAGIYAEVDGTPGPNDMPGRLVFSVTRDGASSPTEAIRITKDGRSNFFADSNVVQMVATTKAASIGDYLFIGRHSSTGYNTGTSCFLVYSNGNVQNTNNSYGAISDIKLKENIVDANSQWDDLKALQVRNYNFKEGQTHTQIGLVAQEVELVSPGLVSESPDRDDEGNDLGTVTKSVNYSVLYMKAVKALQEAMERIEALEADVAQLKGA
jgi:hypothetical protein